LHPEFRTLPSLFYVPPQSPVRTALANGSDWRAYNMVETEGVLPGLEQFRIPLTYLAQMFSAGNEEEVRIALERQLAVRAYRRSQRVEGQAEPEVLERVGLSEEDARQMHRLLAIAHYHERFVIPTTKREQTGSAPFIERGYAGFDELAPNRPPKRRESFHGNRVEVGS